MTYSRASSMRAVRECSAKQALWRASLVDEDEVPGVVFKFVRGLYPGLGETPEGK